MRKNISAMLLLALLVGQQLAQADDKKTLRNLFHYACSDTTKFSQILSRARVAADSADAKANSLVHPQRNKFQVMLTDIATYELYYPDACQRHEQFEQCFTEEALTAEQECDCAAGNIGDVETGIGAGEVLAASLSETGIESCRVAAESATGARRIRYIAQLGKAQIYLNGGSYESGKSLKVAIASGYGRAEMDLARTYIREVEFGGSRTPEKALTSALQHVAAGKAAGALEASQIAKSIAQVANVRRFNTDFARMAISILDTSAA